MAVSEIRGPMFGVSIMRIVVSLCYFKFWTHFLWKPPYSNSKYRIECMLRCIRYIVHDTVHKYQGSTNTIVSRSSLVLGLRTRIEDPYVCVVCEAPTMSYVPVWA